MSRSGIPRALDEALQRRRLFLAGAALLLPAGRAAGTVARTVRYTSVLGLSDLAEAAARERLRLQLAAAEPAAVRRLSEPARFTDFCGAAEALAAAWFAAGARLLSVPEICDERDCVWPLEDRTPALVWAAGTAVTGDAVDFWRRQRIALLHSRKGREVHSGLPWVRATAAAAAVLPVTDAACIGGVQELPAQLARVAAVARGLPVIDVLTEPEPVARRVWLNRTNAAIGGAAGPAVPAALTLSGLWPDEAAGSTGAKHAERSLRRDDLVLALAHRAVAISLRAGGNWQLRLARAAADAGRRERVGVVDPAAWGLADRGGTALLTQGCAVWPAVLPAAVAEPVSGTQKITPKFAPTASRLSLLCDPDWPWLTHWTRRPDGAWPGETPEAWLQRVLAGGVPERTTALDALIRIASQQRIVGGTQFLRHGPAVCLTHWPPGRLVTMARRHRGLNRPLYEPFGIGFRREYLTRKGAAAAVYGDETVWAALAPKERFRFQFEGDVAEPWSVEGEWRVAGDLDFSDAGAEEVCLFVPDVLSAAELAARLPACRIQLIAMDL